ncbi:uncharacterized protein RJT21DRAFT_112687 [Scheffersomyces amazonensis]|uniref:uncharacterized protein n=1 Tax=Scheffersomyces amazonensis TaxID=1078765 RepID=UPI00315DE56F
MYFQLMFRIVTCINSTLQPPTPAISLESLPDEILTQIIDHLNQLNVIDLSLVNSRFHSLCMKKLYKRIVFINKYARNRTIIHRKMDTFIHTNFTITNTYPSKDFMSKFQEIIFNEHHPNIRDSSSVLSVDSLKNSRSSEDQLNQLAIQRYQTLSIFFRCPSYYMNNVKRLENEIKSFQKVELFIWEDSLKTINKLQGMFNGVKSFSLECAGFDNRLPDSAISVLCCKNITELQICQGYQTDNVLCKFIKAMPNIKTLIVNDPLEKIQDDTLEHLSNIPLQKFCLDIGYEAEERLEDNINLVKALFKYCGSTVELVKVDLTDEYSARTTLFSIDLFYIGNNEICKGVNKDIKKLVYWIKRNLHNYPKLRYFTFYHYSFVIDREVQPCEWIEISGKEL